MVYAVATVENTNSYRSADDTSVMAGVASPNATVTSVIAGVASPNATVTPAKAGVSVKVELFGTARLATGKRAVEVVLPNNASRRDFVRALAAACPQLVDHVIRPDLTGLQDGYLLNRSGKTFLQGDAISVAPGDSLLIISNQAGG